VGAGAGLISKPAAFISTISDERGQELLYTGMKVPEVFREAIGLGSVVSLIWFKCTFSFFLRFGSIIYLSPPAI
jgi:SNF family Na+-dependent transporter